MKFLVFNLVVGAALIYLFSGTEGGLERAGETALAAFDTNKPNIELASDKPVGSKTAPPVVKLQSEPRISVRQQAEAEVPPSLSDPIEVPVLKKSKVEPVKLAPEIRKRRDEILNAGAPVNPEPKVNALMSRQDRRQALMQLAEDMEYFSAQAMSH